ncbi:DUF4129 domain-containing protein [Haloarcula sediminis]|uniref:DUF4129 domain-containing protein n=1 Tax=Haloarcula sediminis TaxID=3111777 RepID=UPI002D78081A|nr:DUF4129 domain-containing protein [Haloarcula sp. CK38]
MHTERLLSAGVAIVVIAAVGLSASTLETSMSTDPADAVDVQWDALPLGEDSQGDIEGAAEKLDETYRQSGDGGDTDSQGGKAGDTQAQNTQAGDGTAEPQQAGDEAGDPQDESAGDADTPAGGGAQSDSASDSGLSPAGPPWTLFLWLFVPLTFVFLAYRELRIALGPDGDGPAADSLSPAPNNDVERAWAELVAQASVDRPRTRTPRDCARRAVEQGFDASQVDRLRRTFEDVQYGTTPPTDEQARLARESLARLDGERA